ncbi:Hypp937 [Branchiostoma lanceolatum]|uniref:Hypp937 protein n=1 Tax=Branchiostoma lanceolatum TaxID=7740 RepID=A0A8J9ZF37_BRALA|nr:Hypp937 [Branchiostoma lanceolatum]
MMSDQGLQFKYIFYIKTQASDSWKDLAGFLGFDTAAISNIKGRNEDDFSRLGDVLGEWQARKGDEATMGVLMEALTDVDREGVVRGLKNKFPELKEEPMSQPGPIEKATRKAAGPAGKPGGSGAGAKTTTPTKRRRTSDGAAAKPGGCGAKMVPSAKRRRKIDVEEYFLHTKNQVAADWRDLARCLKFTTPDIDDIDTQHRRDKDRCMELLQQWHTRNGDGATIQALMKALAKAGLKRVVDSLKEEYPELAAGKKSPKGAKQKRRRASEEEAEGEKSPEGPRLKQRRVPGAAPPGGRGGHVSRRGSHVTRRSSTVTAPGGGNADVLMSHQGTGEPTILLINDEYGTSKGGISTINCEVGQTLTKAGAVVYCTALRVPKQDQEAAYRDGVKLIQPVKLDEESVPTLDWLTKYHTVHYPNLPQDVTCIIGHADITDTAARNIWEQRYPQADLMTFNHVIPEDTEYFKGGRKAMRAWEKEKDMLDKSDKAKAAFSVGQRIYEHFDTMYKGRKKPQSHHIFLPKPSNIFLATKVRPGGKQKAVLTVGRVSKVEKLKGHDLAAQSMREVVKEVRNTRLRVRGISEDDWETSLKILEDNLNSPDLNPTLLPYGTQEDIRDDMMTAHLVLMPSRSEPFGLVGLEAIAAGIPVLISDKTGLAQMILDLIDDGKLSAEHRNVVVKTSVSDSDRVSDAKRWAARIVDVLKFSGSEFEKAARFKRELEESRYWEESHRTFLQACGITTAAADL